MKKLLMALCISVSPLCFAGNQSGTINYVNVRYSDGLIYFHIVGGAKVGSPSCATYDYWIIRDENSNAGKQQYAMLLAAQASGKVVTVHGLNSCARWGDGEDVNDIQIIG